MVTFGSPSSGAHGSPDPFNGVYSSLPGHGRTPQPPYSTGRRLSTPKLNRESPPTNNVTTSPGYYTFTSPTATVSFHHHEAGIGAPELQEKRPFRCLYCVSAFTTKDHLENHLKKLHLRDEDKQYNCHHCGKAFWSEDHLRQHDRWSRTCEIAKTTVEDSESNADASSSPRARNAQGLGVIEKTSSKRNQNDCSTPLNQPPTLSHPTQGKVTEGSFSRTVSTRENVIVEEIEEPNTLLSGRRSESQGARGTTSQALGTSNTTANSTPRLQGVLLSSAADHPENPQLSVSMHDDETFDSNSSTCVPPSVETYNNECPEKDRADDSNRHGEDTKGIKETASKEEADDDFWGFTTSKKTKKKKNKKKSDSSRPGSPATFGLSLEVNEPSGPSPGHAIGSQGSGWEDGSRWSFQTSPSKPVKTNNDDDIWGWGTTFSKKATSTSKNLSQSSTNHAGSEFVSPMVKPECRNTDTAKMVAHLDGKDAQTRQEHKSNLRADNCRGLPSLVDPMEIDEPDSQVSLLISERMEVDAQLKTEPRNKAPAENFRSSSSKREQTWGLTTSPFHPYHARVSTYNDHYSDTTQPRPHARAHTQSSFRDYCAQYTSQYSPDAFSPRYAVTGQYATASVRPSSPYRESERPKRPRRHGKSSYSYYLALGYDDPDEDEYIEVNGQTYVIPSAKRTRRHAAYEPAISRSRSDSSYNPYAPGDYESDSRHNRLSTINRRKSSAVPERSRTVRPSEARPKAPTAPIKATEADARKYKIPAGYSLKNWDPVQEPILLLGSVFDGNSLGKWIYDWTVHCHGSSSPLAEISGELWLLLIQLTGKIKRLDETIPTIRSREKRELCEEFADSGERLVDKLKSLLKNCEAPMLKAAKDRKGSQLGRNSGVEFIETLFGRDRELEKTERLMQSVRLWNLRFDVNCEDVLKKPRLSGVTLQSSGSVQTPALQAKKSALVLPQSPQQDLPQKTELWGTILIKDGGQQNVRMEDDPSTLVNWINQELAQRLKLDIQDSNSTDLINSLGEHLDTTRSVQLTWFGKREDETYSGTFYIAHIPSSTDMILGVDFRKAHGGALQICRFQESVASPMGLIENSANEESGTSDDDVTSDEEVVDALDRDHPLFEEVPKLIQIMLKEFEGWRTCKGDSGAGTGGRPSNSSKSGKESVRQPKRGRQAEDDPASDDEGGMSNKNKKPRNTNGSDEDEILLLACPFYKHDKVKHQKCLKLVLKRIKDVKQHLYRSHEQPTFCPICGQIFESNVEFHSHLRARACETQQVDPPEGITEEQKTALKSWVDKRLTLSEQWKSVWRIVFPDVEPPDSPFILAPLQEGLLHFRDFREEQGPVIISNYVREYMQTNNLSVVDIAPNPERTWAALLETVSQGVLDAVIEGYESQLSAAREEQDGVPSMGNSDLPTQATASGSTDQELEIPAGINPPLFDRTALKWEPPMTEGGSAHELFQTHTEATLDSPGWVPPPFSDIPDSFFSMPFP